MTPSSAENDVWPALPFEGWEPTYATLHLWTQIVGKIRLTRTPWINHSWHVPLYVTPSGLTTGPVPHGDRSFEIEFDFIDHRLRIRTSDGETRALRLRPQPVAEFHSDLMSSLEDLDLPVKIHGSPNELPDPIPFAEDRVHASYDPAAANALWRILVQSERVMQRFRARFTGKNSPIHFFWGSFDLAVSRFSGRKAPPHPGGIPSLPDWVVREAYCREVSSAGFWPGGGPHPYPLFYSYIYPEPDGFPAGRVRPDEAFYSQDLHEFILPYEAVRQSPSPDDTLLDFLQSTYELAADLAGWDRENLEWSGDPRRGE